MDQPIGINLLLHITLASVVATVVKVLNRAYNPLIYDLQFIVFDLTVLSISSNF